MNHHPIDVLVATRIRKARIESELTLKQLSDMIGVNPNQLSKYERCKDRITSGRLSDIALLTNKSIGWFYEQD